VGTPPHSVGLNEEIAGQQPVEEQQDEGPRGGHDKPDHADRLDPHCRNEERQNAAADHRPTHPHQQRRHGAARIAAGHDRLGQQPDQRAEAHPDQNQIGPLLDHFRELQVFHGGDPIGLVGYAAYQAYERDSQSIGRLDFSVTGTLRVPYCCCQRRQQPRRNNRYLRYRP